VTSFLQTNLIKLYVEQGDKDSVYKFFKQSHNTKQVYIDHKEIEEFLERYQVGKKPEEIKTCNVTMALILEYTNDNVRALDKWMQLKTEEGCHKTVNILRKSSITKKEIIFKYVGWVLEKMPEIGLSLFVDK